MLEIVCQLNVVLFSFNSLLLYKLEISFKMSLFYFKIHLYVCVKCYLPVLLDFKTLNGFGRILLQSLVLTPLLPHLSDFAFDEELGVEEPTHWETPTEGSVDPEVDA